MLDKTTTPAAEDARQLSDTDLQLAYEKARAAMQKKHQDALDASSEEEVFALYEAERERRSKSDLEKKAEQKA